jgi:hypothetical protein
MESVAAPSRLFVKASRAGSTCSTGAVTRRAVMVFQSCPVALPPADLCVLPPAATASSANTPSFGRLARKRSISCSRPTLRNPLTTSTMVTVEMASGPTVDMYVSARRRRTRSSPWRPRRRCLCRGAPYAPRVRRESPSGGHGAVRNLVHQLWFVGEQRDNRGSVLLLLRHGTQDDLDRTPRRIHGLVELDVPGVREVPADSDCARHVTSVAPGHFLGRSEHRYRPALATPVLQIAVLSGCLSRDHGPEPSA